MSYTLKYLGSNELKDQFTEDISSLITYSKDIGYLPLRLYIGRDILELICIRRIKKEFQLDNWILACNTQPGTLSILLHSYILEVIKKLDLDYTSLTSSSSIEVFYDPDEDYLSLYAVGIEHKPEKGDLTTADGRPIRKFYYREEEYHMAYQN